MDEAVDDAVLVAVEDALVVAVEAIDVASVVETVVESVDEIVVEGVVVSDENIELVADDVSVEVMDVERDDDILVDAVDV